MDTAIRRLSSLKVEGQWSVIVNENTVETELERVFARVILPHNVINNTFEPLFSLVIGKNYSLYNDILNFV